LLGINEIAFVANLAYSQSLIKVNIFIMKKKIREVHTISN